MNSVIQEQIIHHIEKEKIFELYNESTSFYKIKFVQKKILSLRNYIKHRTF